MKKKVIFMLLLINSVFSVKASDSSAYNLFRNFSFNLFFDTYYAYDFFSNADSLPSPRLMTYTCPFNNEFRLNLALVKIKYSDEKMRGTLGFQFGDIPFLRSAVNKQFVKYLNQANFGFKLSGDLWLDMGYMYNPIGWESSSVISDYLTSISFSGLFEPGNALGMKLTYDITKSLKVMALVYNAYNTIQDDYDDKTVGLAFSYNPDESLAIMYAGSADDEAFGSKTQLQVYHNFQFAWTFQKRFDLVGQFDFASQTNSKRSDTNATAWLWAGFAMLRYRFLDNMSITARYEACDDPDGFVGSNIVKGADHLKAWSVTSGLEFKPFDNTYFRAEYQYILSDARIFHRNLKEKQNIQLSAGIRF